MNSFSHVINDSTTMLRRNLLHMLRYPSVTVILVVMPVVFLLLFVYVFGGTMGAGLAVSGGRSDYLAYVVPGILMSTIAAGTTGTAIAVAMDMTEGIIARFRTMDISRAAVLTGHVVGSVIQSALGLAIVTLVAVLIGFRPSAGPVGWLAAIGVMALITFALTWLSVALGMFAKNVESASNLPMPLLLLPFLGSGFVPTSSMPTGLRWFAAYQPFTPFIETVRGFLMGTPIGASGFITVVWCVVIMLGSYVWALRLYNRIPQR